MIKKKENNEQLIKDYTINHPFLANKSYTVCNLTGITPTRIQNNPEF